jgi:EAL domain-containing protein (putative c-di-GMP-specific phosphodiesterase class I)
MLTGQPLRGWRKGTDLAEELHRALIQEELFLEYQPIFRIDTGHIAGVEALVRWAHPEHGRLLPGAFLPAANETGLIRELGYYVLQRALKDFERFCAEGAVPQGFWLSVNVSPLQLLSDDFACNVEVILQQSDASGDALVLEITEDALTPDVSQAHQTLSRLRQRGVRIALDDFGTGYSNLYYLTKLPLDVIKIGKPIIDELEKVRVEHLVTMLCDLVHGFGLETVAEGVERPEQLAALHTCGCGFAQGYVYAPSLGAEELMERFLTSVVRSHIA